MLVAVTVAVAVVVAVMVAVVVAVVVAVTAGTTIVKSAFTTRLRGPLYVSGHRDFSSHIVPSLYTGPARWW